jgi:hypothetical protein
VQGGFWNRSRKLAVSESAASPVILSQASLRHGLALGLDKVTGWKKASDELSVRSLRLLDGEGSNVLPLMGSRLTR